MNEGEEKVHGLPFDCSRKPVILPHNELARKNPRTDVLFGHDRLSVPIDVERVHDRQQARLGKIARRIELKRDNNLLYANEFNLLEELKSAEVLQ